MKCLSYLGSEGTVKSELADRFESHRIANMELFDYIEVFYNRVAYCPTSLCG